MPRTVTRKAQGQALTRGLELPATLVAANVVILARNYNPSIVSRDWLYQKGIVEDAVPNFIHTPVFSLVESNELSLVVDENRLQIAARKPSVELPGKLADLAVRFVELLPETPYTAVGFNYEYVVAKEACDLGRVLSPDHSKLGALLGPSYEVGGTLIFPFASFVVTVSLKPAVSETDSRIRIGFNFHSDVKGSHETKERLEAWHLVLEKAELVVRGLCIHA